MRNEGIVMTRRPYILHADWVQKHFPTTSPGLAKIGGNYSRTAWAGIHQRSTKNWDRTSTPSWVESGAMIIVLILGTTRAKDERDTLSL